MIVYIPRLGTIDTDKVSYIEDVPDDRNRVGVVVDGTAVDLTEDLAQTLKSYVEKARGLVYHVGYGRPAVILPPHRFCQVTSYDAPGEFTEEGEQDPNVSYFFGQDDARRLHVEGYESEQVGVKVMPLPDELRPR